MTLYWRPSGAGGCARDREYRALRRPQSPTCPSTRSDVWTPIEIRPVDHLIEAVGRAAVTTALAAVLAAATLTIHFLALAVAALEVTKSGSSSSGYEVNGLTFFILLPEILLLAGVLGWLVSRGYRTLVLGGFVAAAFLSVIGVSIR